MLPSRWVCAVSAALLSGCYFTQLTGLQLSLLNEQRPLGTAARLEPDAGRRALLGMIPDIRSYARNTVQLPVGRSYTGYYATQAKGILFVVVGSERLQLRPYMWWFPVVGKVAYKSFTREADARAEAERLEGAGFDAWVGHVTAYSTLGFFRDPVTSVMMRHGIVAFVEVLLHEMAHARLYVPGQTDFNEQLASFVGKTAAERYLRSRHGSIPWLMAELRRRTERRERIDRLVGAGLSELETLYASGRPPALIMLERARLFARLHGQFVQLYPEQDRADLVVNNAHLLQHQRYLSGNDRLERFWLASGGSWAEFWRRCESYAAAEL